MSDLFGNDTTEEDAVAYAMSSPLQAKIDRAMAMLKTYESMALKMNEQGYYLAFSGGKDSQVIYHLAEMAGVKFHAVYSVTTIDPPEVVQSEMAW